MDENRKFAVFIDYDNIEIGVKSTLSRELDMGCILEGVKQRGEIVSKIAYGNWGHHPEATRTFAEYGVQMVQRDSTPRGDKNGGDINLALDALEMAFTRDHIDSFAIVSGDSDFMPLVNKLKEYNKRVYVVGGKQFTSTILQRNCHEFISYESLLDLLPRRRSNRGGSGRSSAPPPPPKRSLPLDQAVSLLERSLSALEIRNVQPQLGLLKSTMLQLDPAFTERDFGVSTFSGLMEKLQEQKLIKIKTVDHHLVVERLSSPAGETIEPSASSADREEALPALQETLIAYVDLLEMGIPEREVEALMRASDPDFDEEDYGFQEFGELLNLASDKGLVRVEADSSETLRYYPGPDLHDRLAPIGPIGGHKGSSSSSSSSSRPSRMAAQGGGGGDREEGTGRRRRRRRRRGGRGRGEGGHRNDESAPEGLPRDVDEDEQDALEAAEESKAPEPKQKPEPEPKPKAESEPAQEDDDEEPAEKEVEKPSRKKAAKKKAARKKATRKKAAKKKAARKDDED
ncbi:MAG: NYN domain-containing protein [Bryobacterales bacterium]